MDLGLMELSSDAAFNPDLANALDGFEADGGDAFFGHPFMIDGPGDDGSASMMGDENDDGDDDGASDMFFLHDNPGLDYHEPQNSSARSSSRRPKKNGHAPSVSPSNSDATDPQSDSDTLDSLPGGLQTKSSSGSRKRGRVDGSSGHETKSMSRRRNATDKSTASHQASAHTHTAPGLVKSESCPSLGDESILIEGASPKSRGRLRGREGLTAEEKAELVRQRNREHARAARRRKKRYVEQLQQQVTELLQQQNSSDQSRPAASTADASGAARKDLSGVRRATLQRFLTYRTSQGRGHVVTEVEWRRVIDDNFSLSQPWTPLRSTSANFIHKKIQGRGLNAVIEDAAAIEALVNMVRSHVSRSVNGVTVRSMALRVDDSMDKPSGAANAAATAATVNVECTMRPHDDLLIVGDVAMAQWFISTSGLVAAGLPRECSVDAMLRCTFETGTHRLRELDMTYDVMSFITQLHQLNLLDPNIAGQAIVSSDDETSSVASAKDQSTSSNPKDDDKKKDGTLRRRSTKRSQSGAQTMGTGVTKEEENLSMVTPQDMSVSMMEAKEEEKDQEGAGSGRPKTRRSVAAGSNTTDGSNVVTNPVALASMSASMSVQQQPAPWLAMQSVWPGAMMTQMNQMNQMNQQALQQMNQPWIAPFPTTIQGVQNQCNVMDPNSQSMVVNSMPTSCSMPNLAVFQRNGSSE